MNDNIKINHQLASFWKFNILHDTAINIFLHPKYCIILGFKQNKYNRQMQAQDDLISSYIMNNKFYDEMRSKLKGHLSSKQIKQLIQNINSICRYKNQTIAMKFAHPVTILIIYGELGYAGSMYHKGQYFQIDEGNLEIQITFLKASTLIYLSSEILDLRLEQLAKYRSKTEVIQKCMPIRQLKLNHLEIKKIAKSLEIRIIRQKYFKIPKQSGIYLFFEGIFQICYEEIPILEMENSYIQITDKLQYSIRLKQSEGKYGYIGREDFYGIVSTQCSIEMEKVWRLKQQLKDQYKVKHQYIEETNKIREKIKKKLKYIKNMSVEQNSEKQKCYKEALATSRNTLLQKCSTAISTSKSLHSSRRTNDTKVKKRTLSMFENSTAKANLEGKGTIQLSKSEQRLQKMRHLHKLQNKTQLERDWYHVDPIKTQQKFNVTYWKINNSENSREAKILCNHKRVHKIYSDPCFRKPVNFRNF